LDFVSPPGSPAAPGLAGPTVSPAG
jgi:hypothetical protein